MRDVEREIRDAFNELKVPEGLNDQTLRYIEAKRNEYSAASEGERPVDAAVGMPARRRRSRFSLLAGLAAAACFVVALVGVAGVYSSSKTDSVDSPSAVVDGAESLGSHSDADSVPSLLGDPVAFVDIEVNPSIGLSLDRNNVVVASAGYNDDGGRAMEDLSLVGLPYDEALVVLTDYLVENGAITDDSYCEVSVAGGNQAQIDEILRQSGQRMTSLPGKSHCGAMSEEDFAAAQEAGMGMGRYRAALEAMEEDPSLTLEECEGMSMAELRAVSGDDAAQGGSGAGRGPHGPRGGGRG